MSDQISSEPSIVRHIVVMLEQPIDKKSIYIALKGPNTQHWKQGMWPQYSKNDNEIVLSVPISQSKPPKDIK